METVGYNLKEPLRSGEVLQPVLPDVAERHALGRVEQVARRLRDEHLAPVRRRTDTRSAMHVEPHVAGRRERGLARVDPHADAHLSVARPRVLAEGTLGRHGGGQRVRRAREGEEEAFTLDIDLMAGDVRDGLSQQPVVLRENALVRADAYLLQ